MLVDDADEEATRVLNGTEGTTNAVAPAAMAKVAAISNFICFAFDSLYLTINEGHKEVDGTQSNERG